MKELFDELSTTDNAQYLLDTCFIVYMIEKNHSQQLVEFCEQNNVAITSFTAEEILHIHHRFNGTVNHHFRDFLKKKLISILPVEVSPGNYNAEHAFVNEFNPFILRLVHDPSDAVLFVIALKTKAKLLTRDKHHLFTANAEHYAQEHGIEVLNDLP